MLLKVGLVFQQYYNENNINNVKYCEVREIINNYQIMLLCKKDATEKEFYKMIDVPNFDYNVEQKIFIKIQKTTQK